MAQWQELAGPSAGRVNYFCELTGLIGSEMFAASDHGVYLTTDHAKTWQLTGLIGTNVQRISEYSYSGGVILLATVTDNADQHWKACRSEDTGKTWDTIFVMNSIASRLGILNVMQDGNDIVIGVSGTSSDTAAGMYRSVDIGQHWVHQALPPSGSAVLSDFAIGGGSLFAIAGDTLWSMPSHNAQWVPTSYPYWHHPEAVQFVGNDLFVGGSGRMDISTNNGVSWLAPPNAGLDTAFDSISVSPPDILSTFAVQGATIVASGINGAYLSTNGAVSWQRIKGVRGYPVAYPTADIAFVDSHLFSATDAGIVTSPDGVSWNYSSDGILGGIEQIASNGPVLFATTERGIFRSTDRGQSWIDPSGPQDLVDSLAHYFWMVRGGLYVTGGPGHLWRWDDSEWTALSDSYLSSLTGDSSALFAVDSFVIVRSSDSGQTWETANAGIQESVQSIVAGNGELFAVSIQGSVYSSVDEGTSWNLLSAHPVLGSGGSVAFASNSIYLSNGGDVLLFSPSDVRWDSAAVSNTSVVWPFGSNVVAQNPDGIWGISGTVVIPLLDSLGSGFYYGFAHDDSLVYVADSIGNIHAAPILHLPLAVSSAISVAPSFNFSIFPNPSHGRATASFTLPERESIALKLYDESGVNVGTYYNGSAGPDTVQLPITGAGLDAGAYILQLSTRDGIASREIVLLPR